MTVYNRGDVVLVRFIFSDETGVKHRPALVINANIYSDNRDEVIVAAITSRIDCKLVGDYLIAGWKQAGLLYPSIVTGIIRTVKQNMISQKLGIMINDDMKAVDMGLKTILDVV